MEVSFQRTFSDYQEAIKAGRSRSIGRKILFAVCFVPIYVVEVVFVMSFGLTQGKSSVVVLVFTVIVARLISFGYSLWLKRDFQNHPNFSCPIRIRIDDTGMHSESDRWNADTKWGAYIRYRETENLLLLYLGARSVDVIPKRVLPGGQLDEFRRIVRAKLPDDGQTSARGNAYVENPS